MTAAVNPCRKLEAAQDLAACFFHLVDVTEDEVIARRGDGSLVSCTWFEHGGRLELTRDREGKIRFKEL